jgi:hypothetical protein
VDIDCAGGPSRGCAGRSRNDRSEDLCCFFSSIGIHERTGKQELLRDRADHDAVRQRICQGRDRVSVCVRASGPDMRTDSSEKEKTEAKVPSRVLTGGSAVRLVLVVNAIGGRACHRHRETG